MFLLIQDGKYTVSRIASPSSAIEADVKIGDEIIAISGTPISQMTIEEISNIAKAMNTLGTEIELTFLTTQKKQRTAKLISRKLISYVTHRRF